MGSSARIMLPSYFRGREFRLSDGRVGFAADMSFLIYLAEEIVADSAIGLAIPSCLGHVVESLDILPSAIRERVDVVDVEKSARTTNILLQPVMEELGMEIDLYGSIARGGTRESAELYHAMLTFLAGMEHKLTIDIDVVDVTRMARKLRAGLRNPQARANVAIIEGILNTYKPTVVTSLQMTGSSTVEIVNRFKDFVNDETYKQLTRTARDIGIPEKLNRARERITRLGREILRKPWARAALRLGSKPFSASTKIPIPDSEILESIVGGGYLPPVTSMKKLVDSATANWRSGHSPFVSPRLPDWSDVSETGKFVVSPTKDHSIKPEGP